MSPAVTLRELADAYARSIMEGHSPIPPPDDLRELLEEASPEVARALRDAIGDLDQEPPEVVH